MMSFVSFITAFAVALHTSGLAASVACIYGGDGYPDSVSDADGNDSNVQFDSLGRVTWVEDGAQALTGSAADRTDIAYDEWGRQETITHPLHDLLSGDPRPTTEFVHDAEDNVLSVENENSKTVSFTYDRRRQAHRRLQREKRARAIYSQRSGKPSTGNQKEQRWELLPAAAFLLVRT